MTATYGLWLTFCLIMLVMLAIDLGVNRTGRVVRMREAAGWSLAWLVLALLFGASIWWVRGPRPALEFLTGYLIEQSLSVDNLFVFIMVFALFGVKERLQARVLKWGILGAVVLRLVVILVGTTLVRNMTWLFYLFGAILLYTAGKMAFGADAELEPDKNPLVRLARRLLPMTRRIHGDWFFARRLGLWIASPLFMTLLVIESSDLVFAMDSIPAIFAITLDPFIVLTSNLFAIMGLRSLFFLLANLMGMFAWLKYGIALVLAFVGVKMILMMLGLQIPIAWSLAVIATTLAASVPLSLLFGTTKDEAALETT